MKDISTYRTPGSFVKDLLKEKEWTQEVLSMLLDISSTAISQMLSGKRDIDAKTAIKFSELFGIPAEIFLDIQKKYDLAKVKLLEDTDFEIREKADLFTKLPIQEMVNRGWLDVDNIKNFDKIRSELNKFFHVSSENEIDIFAHAAKKTNAGDEASPIQLAWLYRVKELAREMLVKPFSIEAVRSAIPKLRSLLVSDTAISRVSGVLENCGIRFVVVESLKSSKIDGVCFWLDDNSPVIGMSLRFDRIDNFWFVLRHELEHILRLDGKENAIFDSDLESTNAPILEQSELNANNAAANFCVSQKDLQCFIDRKSPFFTERDIIGFSTVMRVHPGLVAGQLRHKLKIYNRFSKHLVPIRSFLSVGTTMDGWGNVVPVTR